MKKTTILIGTILLLVAVALGCTLKEKSTFIPLDDSNWTQEGINSIADANNKFAVDLYKKYSNEFEDENVFFSPYSISSAFAMVYEGARGRTAEEIKDVFYFPNNTAELRTSFAHMYNLINAPNKHYILKTANALWVQKDFPLSQNYLDVVEKFYGGKATNVDFVNNAEGARQTINSWVEEQTNGKIKDLIPKGVLNSLTHLVLINVIYFKGNWGHQFDKDATHKENFTTAEGNVSVDMMFIEEDFPYYENNETQVLELPYKGGNVSMIVFLPKSNLSSFEANLSLEKIEDLIDKLHTQKVEVYIPKFKFETKYFMSEDLKEMGMSTAFSPGADFSGISSRGGLLIQEVIHQAYIDVNEEGTEAAAATAISVGITALPTTAVFKANHPFMFLILDKDTNEILFMGRVLNPSEE
jgi:serpin B